VGVQAGNSRNHRTAGGKSNLAVFEWGFALVFPEQNAVFCPSNFSKRAFSASKKVHLSLEFPVYKAVFSKSA
jgi:hypothetical protein